MKIILPDVQVLVLADREIAEVASINYTTEVSDEQARSDVEAVARDAGWVVENVRITTGSTLVPGSKPTTTTSVLFEAVGVVDAAAGTLALEPFINALKRFKSIELLYVSVPEMQFRGLEDFENEFVKITMSRAENSYKYRVRVKDSGFEKLGLPVNQPKPEPAHDGARPRAPVALIAGIALLGAVLVYLAVAYLSRPRRAR